VILGCTDCHGGNSSIVSSEGDIKNKSLMEQAHVLPSYPDDWHYPHSANPKATYTLLNREAKEFVRFVNPSDLRVAKEACGACHLETVQAAKRSIMATGAMLFGAATYANNILPFKKYILGEAYTPDGEPSAIKGPPLKDADANWDNHGILPMLYPLPNWETTPPGDIFRVFERGGRNISNLFPETGLPNALGLIQRIEEPGRPTSGSQTGAQGPAGGYRYRCLTCTRLGSMIRSCGFWVRMTTLVTIELRAAEPVMSSMPMIATQDILALTESLVIPGKPRPVTRPYQGKKRVTRSSIRLHGQFPPLVACHVICINPTCSLILIWVTPCGTTNLMHLPCSQRNRSIRLMRKSGRPMPVIQKVRHHLVFGLTLSFQKTSRI
jgi:hypothetical protein